MVSSAACSYGYSTFACIKTQHLLLCLCTAVPAVTELAAASEALLRVLLNNFCGHHDNAGVLLAAEQQPSAAVDAGLQQQQQQLLQQQLLPALLLQQQQQQQSVAATLLSTTKYASSGSSNRYFGHQYQSVRQASSRSRRSTAASTAAAAARKQLFLGSSDQSHSLTDLQHHMAAAGVPEAVAAAILSKANTWPSLSRVSVLLRHFCNSSNNSYCKLMQSLLLPHRAMFCICMWY